MAILLTAVAAGLLASMLAQGADADSPLPLGSPESSWTDSEGRPNLSLMPSRSLVSTFDGGILRADDGTAVTAPLGDAARGEISTAEADRQFAAVQEFQRRDACARGLVVPLEASGTGGTIEESQADAQAALAKAVADNGGRTTTSAC